MHRGLLGQGSGSGVAVSGVSSISSIGSISSVYIEVESGKSLKFSCCSSSNPESLASCQSLQLSNARACGVLPKGHCFIALYPAMRASSLLGRRENSLPKARLVIRTPTPGGVYYCHPVYYCQKQASKGIPFVKWLRFI